MARRKRTSYRKRRQNRMSMVMVAVVVVMIIAVVSISSMNLKAKNEVQQQTISSLNEQIANEEKRSQEIEEYRKYTQTKKYAEEVAKEKLGLVYEGEIIFKEEN